MSSLVSYVDQHPRLFVAVVLVAGFVPWGLMTLALLK